MERCPTDIRKPPNSGILTASGLLLAATLVLGSRARWGRAILLAPLRETER
jgi:hypothetical protein